MMPIKMNTINSGSPANKRSNGHRKKIFPNMIMFGFVCYIGKVVEMCPQIWT